MIPIYPFIPNNNVLHGASSDNQETSADFLDGPLAPMLPILIVMSIIGIVAFFISIFINDFAFLNISVDMFDIEIIKVCFVILSLIFAIFGGLFISKLLEEDDKTVDNIKQSKIIKKISVLGHKYGYIVTISQVDSETNEVISKEQYKENLGWRYYPSGDRVNEYSALPKILNQIMIQHKWKIEEKG